MSCCNKVIILYIYFQKYQFWTTWSQSSHVDISICNVISLNPRILSKDFSFFLFSGDIQKERAQRQSAQAQATRYAQQV